MINASGTIRVLIVDDSAFMRRAISKMLESEADINVVGMAATGEEGMAMQIDLKPDLITMDVEMPGIGGLEAARTIIARRGPPIIMISSLTRDGAETTLRALEIGAVDFIPKPDAAYIDILRVKADLVEKVRLFGGRARQLRTRVAPLRPPALPPAAPLPAASPLRSAGPVPSLRPPEARVAPRLLLLCHHPPARVQARFRAP